MATGAWPFCFMKVEVKAVSNPFMDLKFMVYRVECDMSTIGCSRFALRAAIANPGIEAKALSDPCMDFKIWSTG